MLSMTHIFIPNETLRTWSNQVVERQKSHRMHQMNFMVVPCGLMICLVLKVEDSFQQLHHMSHQIQLNLISHHTNTHKQMFNLCR